MSTAGFREPTWLQVGDRIVTKVRRHAGGSSDAPRLRTRTYGIVAKVVCLYEPTSKGWEVRPYARIAHHTRIIPEGFSSTEVHGGGRLDHGETEIAYDELLCTLAPDEWTRLETIGWPFDVYRIIKKGRA